MDQVYCRLTLELINISQQQTYSLVLLTPKVFFFASFSYVCRLHSSDIALKKTLSYPGGFFG